MNILITDGENRSALAATRSLGKRGYRVVVTGKKLPNISASSRYCSQAYCLPDPLYDCGEYAVSIKKLVIKEKIDVVLPITEPSIYLLNQIRKKLPPNIILACSNTDTMNAVSDKILLFRLAEKLHIPVPQTFYLSGPGDLDDYMDRIEDYPVVIKPAWSRIMEKQGFLSGGIQYASSRQELKRLYATNRVLQYPSMIQEKIVGPGTGLFTLYDTNRHLAFFSHRRVREKPPSGGVSVISESVSIDEEMAENAGKLLSAVGWSGVAMVEFKRDLRDGKAKLMEINGRFWGTLQLAITCGINFPVLYLDYLQGDYTSFPVKNFLVGHKLKWFLGTLDHLVIRLKNNGNNLNLSKNSPSKGQALIDFLKVWEKNTSFDVIDRKDLKPFQTEILLYIRHAIQGIR